MMKWLNLIGITLQFISFWFAAPELLGSDALKRFENGLVKFISALPSILVAGGSIVFGFSMAVYGTLKGLEASAGQNEDPMRMMISILAISLVMMIYLIFFSRRTQKWATKAIAQPIIHKLINNNESRKTALVIGAVLFTIGFLVQVVVIVLS